MPQLQHSCSQQQLSDICNLVQSCEQVEYALARGMEKLHQILHNATTEGERGLKLTSAPQQMRFLKQVTNACMHSFILNPFFLYILKEKVSLTTLPIFLTTHT